MSHDDNIIRPVDNTGSSLMIRRMYLCYEWHHVGIGYSVDKLELLTTDKMRSQSIFNEKKKNKTNFKIVNSKTAVSQENHNG